LVKSLVEKDKNRAAAARVLDSSRDLTPEQENALVRASIEKSGDMVRL